MIACANATELYLTMESAIGKETRLASNPPCDVLTVEARPGCTFVLTSPVHNVVACKHVDLRWAVANALHFFATTEEAKVLTKYNKLAGKFLTRGKWVGAYGAIAMPQIAECCRILRDDSASRRAVVSMGGPYPSDINRPACWSHLHFLKYRGRLDMLVYQRSLNLAGVMAYDAVVLTNVLLYVAQKAGIPPGELIWTIGSLHVKSSEVRVSREGPRFDSLVLPFELADSSHLCMAALEDPTTCSHQIAEFLG